MTTVTNARRRTRMRTITGMVTLALLGVAVPELNAQWTDPGGGRIFHIGNVGIGTENPDGVLTTFGQGTGQVTFYGTHGLDSGARAFFVQGSHDGVSIMGSTSSGTTRGDFALWTADSERIRITTNGDVGIGTSTPDGVLTTFKPGTGQVTFYGTHGLDSGARAFFIQGSHDGVSIIGSTSSGISRGDFALWTADTERIRVTTAGNVGVGTATPAAKLHVAGDAVVDGNLAAKYQDVAEWVPTKASLSEGTVVAVDGSDGRQVIAAAQPYDTRVAGVVSFRPGLLLGEGGADKVKVAHSGRVKVKVDASYGAIGIGDLLVTSPTPGYAMRSVPIQAGETTMHRPGTLLGKALEPRDSGQGEILVLLMLQ